jgi:hypothetical protein
MIWQDEIIILGFSFFPTLKRRREQGGDDQMV